MRGKIDPQTTLFFAIDLEDCVRADLRHDRLSVPSMQFCMR